MKIIFEDPDFDIFDLDKFAFEDLVKDKYLLLNIGKALIMDTYGIDRYNLEEDTFIEDFYIEAIQGLRCAFFILSFPLLHPHIIQNAYSVPVQRFQILLKIYRDNIIKPVEVRVNNDVKGKILGTFEVNVSESMKIKKLSNSAFILEKGDEKYSHITVINQIKKQNSSLFCYLKLKNKEYSNCLDLSVPYTFISEEGFLKYAKGKGYAVSSKTLRNYRNKSHQCVFPMPRISKDPISGIQKKYYSREWIKYLKRIKELKDMLKNNEKLYLKYSINTLRDLDNALGMDNFKDIPYSQY